MTKRTLFVLAAVILAAAGLYFRSQAATEAHKQVVEILRQDTAGSDVTPAIASLRAYVSSRAGASVEFTLDGSYKRAQTAAKAAAATSADNSRIYADAQRSCAGKNDSVTQARCNQAYLASHLAAVPAPKPVVEPKLADYQYSLRSPFWTPDIAGALLLGAAAALAMVAVLLLAKLKRSR